MGWPKTFAAWVSLSAVACAQTAGDTRGASPEPMRDAGDRTDLASVDVVSEWRPDATRNHCERGIDLAREGELVAGGHRVAVDFRGLPPVSVDGSSGAPLTFSRFVRVLSFTAPADGAYAVYAPFDARAFLSMGLVSGCDPVAWESISEANGGGETLFGGYGRRFRVRRGQTLRIALGALIPEPMVVVHVRRMTDRALAEPCTDGDACEPGTYCNDGRCAPSGAAFTPCELDGPPCNEGLVCEASSPHPVCLRPYAAGEGCYGGWRCAPGLHCSATIGRCVAPGAIGARCATDAPCDDGLLCGPSGACMRPAGHGDRCNRDEECPDGNVCAPFGEPGGRCVAPGEPGGPCLDGPSPCPPDLYCSGIARRCFFHLAPGSTCIYDATFTDPLPPASLGCGDGACGDTRRCEPAGARGQPCRDRLEALCDAGLRCIRGRCVEPIAVGDPCGGEAGRDCFEGVCTRRRCLPASGRPGEGCRVSGGSLERCEAGAFCNTAGLCERIPGLGEACTSQCDRGLVCASPSATAPARCLFANAAARACGPGGTCAAGRVCVEGECVTPGVCERGDGPEGPAPCGVERFCVAQRDGYACVPSGAEGSRCRVEGPPCDAGLSCSVWGVCRRAWTPWFPCAVVGFDVCPGGTACMPFLGRPAERYCYPDGLAFGRCRMPFRRTDACAPGLTCDVTTGTCRETADDARCGRQRVSERTCAEGADCAPLPGARCVRDGAMLGRCRPYEPRCDEGAVCDGRTQRCVRPVPEGSPCPAEDARCADGLVCLLGRCARRGEVDARCDGAALASALSGCAEGFVCLQGATGSRCAARRDAGASCRNDDMCRGGLRCVADRCVRPALLGEACATMGAAPVVCVEGTCTEGLCRARGSPGGACDSDADCAPPTRCGDGICRSPGDACPVHGCPAEGSERGVCRLSTSPRCDEGLRCSAIGPRCLR